MESFKRVKGKRKEVDLFIILPTVLPPINSCNVALTEQMTLTETSTLYVCHAVRNHSARERERLEGRKGREQRIQKQRNDSYDEEREEMKEVDARHVV